MKHSRYTLWIVMILVAGFLFMFRPVTANAAGDDTKLETPVITLTATAKGAQLSWKSVPGAQYYRVYRRTYSGSYAKLTDVTDISYTDTTADANTTYYYTVRAVKVVDGKESLSSYHSGHIRLACPKPTVENYTSGVKIAWTEIQGAAKYRVYRKTSTTEWAKLGETTSLSYTDKTGESGTVYYYTVRGIDSNNIFGSFVTAQPIARLSRPEVKLTATTKGASLTWDPIPGAESYRVYRKTYSGDYTRIANLTGTSYTDTTADPNTTYHYTVRAIKMVNGKESLSAFHSGHIRLACPKPTVENYTSGVKIAWTQIQGAVKYRVYRRTASTEWGKLDETTSLSYTDKTAESGTVYYYTVRGIDSSNIFGSFVTAQPIARLSRPEVKLTATTKGADLTWEAVPGAESYRIYRKTYSGSYSRIANVTGTSYKDTTADPNTTYHYTVRAIKVVNGVENLSAYHSGHIRLSCPKPTVTNVSTGVKVEWTAITGAVKYRVYRKTSTTEWAKLGETTSLSYTDKTAVNGTTYNYTVRGIDSNNIYGSFVTSSQIYHVSAPVFTAGHSLKGTKISWKAIPNAEKYRVYRKIGNGAYAKLADVTGTSYVDTTGVVGTEYGYTVRAVIGSNWSGYRSAAFVDFSIPYILDSEKAGSETSKKGIQCGNAYEVLDYNAENVYLHLNLSNLLSTSPNGDPLYTYQGTSYYLYPSRMNDLAGSIQSYKNYYGGKTVTIVLVSSNVFPGLTYSGTGGSGVAYYGLNVTDAASKKNVQALLDKIADVLGSGVDNWVVGNEVDCPAIYNYCDGISEENYKKNYYNLVSMVHKTMAKKNSDVCTMVPLDQGWTHTDANHFSSKKILTYMQENGNFNWGVALHPYPVDLRNSNWWDDTKTYANAIQDNENTDMYSMANIGTISSYIANNMKYNGKSRYIAITEVGFNAAVNGVLKEEQQAASLAYAYYKAEADPNIKLFIYNAMRDSWDPSYLFGIQDVNNNKRPSFYTFYFMDTPIGSEVTKPYLKTLGVSNWQALVPSLDTTKFERKVTITKETDTTYRVTLGNNKYYTGFIKMDGKNYYCGYGLINTETTGTVYVLEIAYEVVNGVLQLQ